MNKQITPLRQLLIGISMCTISLGYVYATPYISIMSLKNAIERKDIEEANKFINYRLVRLSLEKEVEKEVSSRLLNKQENTSVSELELMFLKPIIKKVSEVMIESTVNPKGLKVLLLTGNFIEKQKLPEVNTSFMENTSKTSTKKRSSSNQEIRLYYESPTRFILESRVQGNKRKVTSLWTRKNLFTWQLTSINLSYYKSIAH